jgi:hypothetical protein
MQGPTSKKTNEPHKRVNHKGIVKLPNPLQLQETCQIRKGGGPAERGQGKKIIMETQIFHHSKI